MTRTLVFTSHIWSFHFTLVLVVTRIHKYATFYNALFSRMQRIPKKFTQNFEDELSIVATLMFAILHVLLNNSALLKHVQSYHPYSCQYIDMQPFEMHCFQECRRSLESLWKNLGMSYPPLLYWWAQFCMCYSTARHCWTLSKSTHPHSHEYIDMQPFAMHYF